jgi:hypothetical protein
MMTISHSWLRPWRTQWTAQNNWMTIERPISGT